jgi:L-alanine-DL-glutamate epimerase-like enolase superfamily enzyme
VARNWVFVQIGTDEGITGIGEATTEYHELAVKAQIESELRPPSRTSTYSSTAGFFPGSTKCRRIRLRLRKVTSTSMNWRAGRGWVSS